MQSHESIMFIVFIIIFAFVIFLLLICYCVKKNSSNVLGVDSVKSILYSNKKGLKMPSSQNLSVKEYCSYSLNEQDESLNQNRLNYSQESFDENI